MKKDERFNKTHYQSYEETIIKLIKKIKNKELLKRILALTEYLYLYKDDD